MGEERIQLAHGGGGLLSSELIEKEILSRFGNQTLNPLPDGAKLPFIGGNLIFSTDSHVVTPLEFPGGDIGDLAVNGTLNDISVSGGKPLWLSLALILEEGLPLATLRRMLDSVKSQVEKNGVEIVTGDTKVVGRGQADGMYINTSGIGVAMPNFNLSRDIIQPGDKILINGTIGDHGAAVLCEREGIDIENGPVSDTACVFPFVEVMFPYAKYVRFMRDPTRGGVAAILNEIVSNKPFGVELDETILPFSPNSRAVAEMLGLDLLNSACEGRLLAICAAEAACHIHHVWRELAPEGHTAIIGEINDRAGKVSLKTLIGGSRLVDIPKGEQLPRIC